MSISSSTPSLVVPAPTIPHETKLRTVNFFQKYEGEDALLSDENSSPFGSDRQQHSEISTSTSEFTWEQFWRSVDDLLSILPKPLFDEKEDSWIKIRAPDVQQTRSPSPTVDDFFIVPNESSAYVKEIGYIFFI